MADETRALTAARQRVAAIKRDPLAAAQRQIEQENQVAGAFAVVHAMVTQAGGGPITLSRELVQAPDPTRKLDVAVQPDGSVIVRLESR